MDEYKLTIGIETHVQFNTKTGLFAGGVKENKDIKPNSVVNHIDFGLPGALPVINEEAINKAIKSAYALNSTPSKYSTFDRKHYFYPDLPMGYQITQFYQPIIEGGYLEINIDGKTKKIGITRAHLEADAGKSMHPEGKDYSLVDLNRSGTPLLEIVSEPEMHSAIEAKEYAKEIWLLMRYAGVSNADLYQGNMRFDVNISLSKTDKLGTRAEIKNINSFRSVERAINYEAARQLKLLQESKEIVQETRGWDDNAGKTYEMRTKENADDYRYMPDPDLPPIVLTEDMVNKIKETIPTLPSEWRNKLEKHSLDISITDSLLVAELDTNSSNLDFLISLDSEKAKTISNWIINIELPLREEKQELNILDADRHKMYLEIYEIYKRGEINSNSLKVLILNILSGNKLPENLYEFAKSSGSIQKSNPDELISIIKEVIKENEKAANDVINGEIKAIGFLVGQVMKRTAGQANPEIVQKMIKNELGV